MRTRRRPALQDKTPGNTPQSHHSIPSKAREALFSAPRKPLGALPMAPDAVPVVSDENGTPLSAPPSPKPHHVRRVPQPPSEPLEETGSEISAPPTPTPARIRRPVARPSDVPHYSDIHSDAAQRSDVLSAAMLPVREEREPLAYGASSDSSVGTSPSPVKTMKWPASLRRTTALPTFRPLAESAPSPLPTKHVRMSSSSRPSGGLAAPPPPPVFEHRTPSFVPPTPKPKHVKTLLRPANEDDGVLASPTPIKTGFGPLPTHSTPLPFRRRRPRLPLSRLPARAFEAAAPSSKAKGKQRAREESLPPSSPPPVSPPGSHGPAVEPFAVHEDLIAELEDDEPLEPEDKENMAAGAVPLQKERSKSSEDDPFGFIAAERKLKALRRDKGKAPAARRAPLGTLVVSRRTPSPTPGPSTMAVLPLQLPTPDGGSEADQNQEDDRFVGIDSPGLAREAPELPDPAPSDPVVQPAYDNNSDVLSYADPDEIVAEIEVEAEYPDDEDKENAAPVPEPTLPIASIPTESAPGSPELGPTRTPHKPKSAKKRSPLPTPHFECESSEAGEETPSRSMGPAELLDLSSSVPLAKRWRRGIIEQDDMRQPEAEEREEEPPESEREEEGTPKRPVTRKRRRGQAEDEDPLRAAKKLENLLPKRPAKRTKRASDEESESSEPLAKRTRGRGRGRGRGRARGTMGRGRGRGRGKSRADEVSEEESGTESDGEEDEGMEGKTTSRGGTARGRVFSRGRGSSSGRGRGASSSRPPSSSARVTRSRSQKPPSKPDSKGKKRARDEGEEIDIEEDEERARSRQARIEYFRKLDEYSLEKEDVYVI